MEDYVLVKDVKSQMAMVTSVVYARTIGGGLEVRIKKDEKKKPSVIIGGSRDDEGCTVYRKSDIEDLLERLSPRLLQEVERAASNVLHPLTTTFKNCSPVECLAFCQKWVPGALHMDGVMDITNKDISVAPKIATKFGTVVDSTHDIGGRPKYLWLCIDPNEHIGILYKYTFPTACFVLEIHPEWRSTLGGKKMSFKSIQEMRTYIDGINVIKENVVDADVDETTWPNTQQIGLWMVAIAVGCYMMFTSKMFVETYTR
jgi:hypothetical protein